MFFCEPDAPEAEALIEHGLHEGPRNIASRDRARRTGASSSATPIWSCCGSRTTRRRRSTEVLPTGLWDRWRRRAEGACPIRAGVPPGPARIVAADRVVELRPKLLPEWLLHRSRDRHSRTTSRCCSILPYREARAGGGRRSIRRGAGRRRPGRRPAPAADGCAVAGARVRWSAAGVRGGRAVAAVLHRPARTSGGSTEIIDAGRGCRCVSFPLARRSGSRH